MMASVKEKNNQLAVTIQMDERKQKILMVIIKLYLETGEPVGSRTISKRLDLSLSSATIRNEMSDLEEMGFIVKPHTSAGRIPSDKGYRFYVDNLIKEKENEITNLKAEMNARVDKLEDMLKSVVKAIASNTNYPAMISGPSMNDKKIKYVQLSNLEDKKILIVVVSEGNVVKTDIVDVSKKIEANELLDISMEFNNVLSGVKICDLKSKEIENELSKYKKNIIEIKIILNSIIKVFEKEDLADNIWTYGSNNFFKYKEFTENENAGSLVETFEKKQELARLVDMSKDINEETGLKIYIGEESNVNAMKNCSVITANCDFGNGMKGTIGVVGPKRMDYEKVLKTIKNTMQSISKDLQ